MTHELTDDIPAYVDAAAALLDLPIATENRDAVIGAMTMIMAQAELVLAFAVPDAIEAAPRFTPC
jgi:hypothetical protein